MIPIAMSLIMSEIAAERARQDAKWGEQNHPDGTGPAMPRPGFRRSAREAALDARHRCQMAAEAGNVTWRHILDEEVAEAFSEDEVTRLRAELIQVAAVAEAWVEAIDRRGSA